MQEIIKWLLDNGWKADGETNTEVVRIPTRRNPLYGKSGGELATFGGRLRFNKGYWFVTIGKRTTCFYQKKNHGITNSINVKTTLPAIQAADEVILSI